MSVVSDSDLNDGNVRVCRYPGAECKQIEDEKGKSALARRTPFQRALNLDTLRRRTRSGACRAHTPVPVALSALLMALYVLLGACVFQRTERWSLLEGCYFSFSSLATIGFGDLRPGRGAAPDAAIGVCCAYILLGVVVVATGFNLIHEDSAAALRRLAALCAGRERAVHGLRSHEHAHAHAPPS